ncbi:hypothetical protein LOZ12_000981 [Ophidiomyces ophidiicola]|uniref:Uncharacterized protein n=1 Tax=Ophidiomyces ophidiicola TaxID=1387563 RepID=A0ACB8V4N7_9EURO|nr:hypothetical protein LOZ62_004945 [Ophidiomyces ophidiicola]KAI1969684.1 hypothetical protein LOZ56_004255 [Ophidiomyces ophidiicola]KAI1999786.1 hypothetical protein LOZ50_006483 [Ophidiomyces ophidiicola]KAI2025930.1 hypothetical protein LOZ45_003175 [Ophidiomyces ophidiicola]KAI2035867.1 hypothetical protein LOZ47_004400 [Ophidiomyces ophidiicola]
MTAPRMVESSSNTPSVLASIRAADLLALGRPFAEFPQYSILDLQRSPGIREDASHDTSNFAQWLSRRLQEGRPFVIRDFDRLPEWDRRILSIEGLIEHSTKKNIPIRNCSTGRDLSFTLKKFADAARQSYKEFKNLYARDLQCPQTWVDLCRKLLPSEVQWAGRLDLFQWLPPCARSEVMMVFVGSEGSSSGFHRCFSSTVALNLLVEGSDHPVLCFGTDFKSQSKYDTFMASRGASPHIDWLNLGSEDLKQADFPLYVWEQQPGDLVVFPPATAHQVWNLGSLSTKIVWNILHPLSLEAGMAHAQPPFNRLCHPDVAQTNLSLACAMLSLLRENTKNPAPPDLHLLTRLFRQMVREERIVGQPATSMTLVRVPETAIVTCDFCSTAIWNRHLRCSECEDFDLCLNCFLNGRSCEHIQSYSWAEIVPQETCARVLDRAQQLLGYRLDDDRSLDLRKSLGTAVNDLILAKQNTFTRLCHLCRIDHLAWKGRRCDRCSAFFCFRGLYRHFDVNSAEVMRQASLWICPKCLETCNCRCCHFPSAYVKAEKPASKRRVKPADSRGKIMGFTDNVFDQKRRTITSTSSANQNTPTSSNGNKRPLPTTPPNMDNLLRASPDTPVVLNAIHGRDRNPENSISNFPNDKAGKGNMDDDQVPTKVQKLLHGSSRTATQTRDDGKVLHSIDYITRMPSPTDDLVSLPPLKSVCSPECTPDLPSPPATKRLPSNVVTFKNTSARRKNATAPQHSRGLDQFNRESKHNLDHSPPILPMTFNPLPPNPTPHGIATNQLIHLLSSQTAIHSPPTQFRPTTTSTIASNTAATPLTVAAYPPSSSFDTLECQLRKLRQYAEELLSLSLFDSHRLLQHEIHHLEDMLLLAKRERSKQLIKKLEIDFPGLVGVKEGIQREAAKLGYF